MTTLRLPEIETSLPVTVATVPVDLETWRQRQRLTYEQLAEMLGIPSLSQVRRYAVGEERMSEARIERVIEVTGGAVDVYALHRRRLEWLRTHAPERLCRPRGGEAGPEGE